MENSVHFGLFLIDFGGMKAYLSKNTVRELVLMLDDAYQVDSEEPIFDYIGIMKNLVLANKYRDEDNQLELSSDTINWLFSVLDTMMFKQTPSKKKMSEKSKNAFNKRLKEQRW